jgi:hypothetical protein
MAAGIALGLCACPTHAGDVFTQQSGAWNKTNTWQGGAVPGANDTAVIQGTHTVNLTAAGEMFLPCTCCREIGRGIPE